MTKLETTAILISLFSIIGVTNIVYFFTKKDSAIDFSIDHNIIPPHRSITHVGDRIKHENRLLRNDDR